MLPRPPRSPLFPYTTLFRSTMALWLLDTTTGTLSPVAARSISTFAPNYGFCMYHSKVSGKFKMLRAATGDSVPVRSEEHTSELQSHVNLVCRLLLEKKKTKV